MISFSSETSDLQFVSDIPNSSGSDLVVASTKGAEYFGFQTLIFLKNFLAEFLQSSSKWGISCCCSYTKTKSMRITFTEFGF